MEGVSKQRVDNIVLCTSWSHQTVDILCRDACRDHRLPGSRLLCPVPVRDSYRHSSSCIPVMERTLGETCDYVLDTGIKGLFKQGEVGSMPCRKQDGRVCAVTNRPAGVGIGFDIVPGNIGYSVNTSNLIPPEWVGLVHRLEALHGQQVQIPLVSILLQRSYLKPRVKRASSIDACDCKGCRCTAEVKRSKAVERPWEGGALDVE